MTHKYIGKRIQRNEDPRLLTGQALFVDDVNIPGMLHAAFLRSDYAHARLKSIDVSAARERPGVIAVFTAEDMGADWKPGPPLVSPPPTLKDVVFFSRTQVPLVKDKVRHAGEAIAVVVAESVQAEPNSDSAKLRLGDALWRRGDYDEAAKLYIDVARRDANFAASDVFRSRVERRADGGTTVLTPQEVTRRAADKNPLKVINTNSFSGVRDSITQIPLYFIVTGQAVNQAQSTIYGVQVTVTIYGFGNAIYDTQTTNFGDMAPGETRAFSMRFSNYRELNSIDRYEYSVAFRR